jgi:hypothetical protein
MRPQENLHASTTRAQSTDADSKGRAGATRRVVGTEASAFAACASCADDILREVLDIGRWTGSARHVCGHLAGAAVGLVLVMDDESAMRAQPRRVSTSTLDQPEDAFVSANRLDVRWPADVEGVNGAGRCRSSG